MELRNFDMSELDDFNNVRDVLDSVTSPMELAVASNRDVGYLSDLLSRFQTVLTLFQTFLTYVYKLSF